METPLAHGEHGLGDRGVEIGTVLTRGPEGTLEFVECGTAQLTLAPLFHVGGCSLTH